MVTTLSQPVAPPISLPAAGPAAERRRHDLKAIVVEGAAYSVMVGLGESYFAAYCLAMGVGELWAGLVATVPLVAGAVLQLVSPGAVRTLGSHRRWVVLCVTAQACALFPLAWGAAQGRLATPWVFLTVAVYFGAGLASAPAWSTWAGRLVPDRCRARYFARRTRVGQFCVMLAFLLAGIALNLTAGTPWLLSTFAVTFGLAAGARLFSAAVLTSQSELPPGAVCERSLSLREFWRRPGRPGTGRLLLYLLLVQGVVQISGPFFAPYMLKQLQLPYFQFALLTACAYVSKVLALPACGRLAQRHGARRLLWLGGVAITPVAALWLVSRSFWFLLGVQVLSGTAWAAYELAIFLLFFESVGEEVRTSLLTIYNFFHALATLLGSLAGAALIATLGKQPETYLVVFATSSLGRAGTLLVLVSVVPSVWIWEAWRRRATGDDVVPLAPVAWPSWTVVPADDPPPRRVAAAGAHDKDEASWPSPTRTAA